MIAGRLQKSEPVNFWYAPYIDLRDLKDMLNKDSTTYSPGSVPKNMNLHSLWANGPFKTSRYRSTGKAIKDARISAPVNYIDAAFTYISFGVENDQLASLSHLEKGWPRFDMFVHLNRWTGLIGSHLGICSFCNTSMRIMMVAQRYSQIRWLSLILVFFENLAVNYNSKKSIKAKGAS